MLHLTKKVDQMSKITEIWQNWITLRMDCYIKMCLPKNNKLGQK